MAYPFDYLFIPVLWPIRVDISFETSVPVNHLLIANDSQDKSSQYASVKEAFVFLTNVSSSGNCETCDEKLRKDV